MQKLHTASRFVRLLYFLSLYCSKLRWCIGILGGKNWFYRTELEMKLDQIRKYFLFYRWISNFFFGISRTRCKFARISEVSIHPLFRRNVRISKSFSFWIMQHEYLFVLVLSLLWLSFTFIVLNPRRPLENRFGSSGTIPWCVYFLCSPPYAFPFIYYSMQVSRNSSWNFFLIVYLKISWDKWQCYFDFLQEERQRNSQFAISSFHV